MGEPQPQGGSQPNVLENTKERIGPKTKAGKQTPNNAKPIGTRSKEELGYDEAKTPTGIPINTAKIIETVPSVTETGILDPIISFTVHPGYLSEGPKSPCSKFLI